MLVARFCKEKYDAFLGFYVEEYTRVPFYNLKTFDIANSSRGRIQTFYYHALAQKKDFAKMYK